MSPRIVVLSRKANLYSTSRLAAAAKERGATPLILDTLRCTMVVSSGACKILYRGKEVTDVTAVIPRIGNSITGYGVAVVNHFESMNVRVLNTARGISRSRDKIRCLQVLANHNIDIPRTVMASRGADTRQLIEQVGGLPCIIKLLRGTQGVGVMIATTVKEAKTIIQTFWGLSQDVSLQEMVRESRGRDVRALVVGNRVVAAMRRSARQGDFRSNIHRGGSGVEATLDERYASIAVQAAKIVGLEVCGVDMLEGANGPRVIELNSSPGFEGLERATKADIAGSIVAHALLPAEAS